MARRARTTSKSAGKPRRRRAKRRKPDLALPPDTLRWRVDPESLPFKSTAEVEPARTVVGQDDAVEALRFGLECYAPGQNIYVRGLTGTGRMTLLRQLLEQIQPGCPPGEDRAYVHNFRNPDRPRLLLLPRGSARAFAQMVDEMITFIQNDLARALGAESVRERQGAIEAAAQEESRAAITPLEAELAQAGIAVVTVRAGAAADLGLFPRVEGKPVPPEKLDKLEQQGKVTAADAAAMRVNLAKYADQLDSVTERVRDIQRQALLRVRALYRDEARTLLAGVASPVARRFPQPLVAEFLDDVIGDVVENRLGELENSHAFIRRYRVNVILSRDQSAKCPIVIENAPSMANLVGSIDRQATGEEAGQSDHMMITGGALLAADGGYLLLEARDVLREPGAWKSLIRTLRSGKLEIVPPETSPFWFVPSLKPEPIPVNIKVVLIGDHQLYYLLDDWDADFPQLFKVLADFDTVIARDEAGSRHYAAIIARIAQEDKLPAFDRGAVAALIEHGARVAGRGGKLTARFSRVADIAREAAFLARTAKRPLVTADDVRETVRRTKRRADLPSRRFREAIAKGVIRVRVEGSEVGQVNGLAVLTAGPLTYGFPNRITGTIGPGTAGLINIEGKANLSGDIHTKGFLILGGCLRYLLQTDHPLAFDVSIAFEQSYGAIDGDSASAAQMCCILSALTDVPLRQDLAITGALDQHGQVMAVGAVNEKIEGFFDTCRDVGMTGTQGVIIPRDNAADLMLRWDVVQAAERGEFRIYPAATIHEALALLTGERVVPRAEGEGEGGGAAYPRGTLLATAMEQALTFWQRANGSGSGAGRVRQRFRR
jgi:ATP-dependent Lon protease